MLFTSSSGNHNKVSVDNIVLIPSFINAAVKLCTSFCSEYLLNTCLMIVFNSIWSCFLFSRSLSLRYFEVYSFSLCVLYGFQSVVYFYYYCALFALRTWWLTCDEHPIKRTVAQALILPNHSHHRLFGWWLWWWQYHVYIMHTRYTWTRWNAALIKHQGHQLR